MNKFLAIFLAVVLFPIHSFGVMDLTAASSHYVLVGNIVPGSTFSIGGWGYKKTTGQQIVVAQVNSGITLATFYLRVGGNSGFSSATSTFREVAVPDVALNEWHHHFLTYSGSTLRYYLDGTQVASASVTGTPSALGDGAAIGRLGSANREYWNGFLSDVRVYGRSLSASEVQWLGGSKSGLHLSDRLLGRWIMDEGITGTTASGATVIDRSGNGETGTPTNGPSWLATNAISYP